MFFKTGQKWVKNGQKWSKKGQKWSFFGFFREKNRQKPEKNGKKT